MEASVIFRAAHLPAWITGTQKQNVSLVTYESVKTESAIYVI